MNTDVKIFIATGFIIVMTIVLLFISGSRYAALDCERACGSGRVVMCGETIKCREDK